MSFVYGFHARCFHSSTGPQRENQGKVYIRAPIIKNLAFEIVIHFYFAYILRFTPPFTLKHAFQTSGVVFLLQLPYFNHYSNKLKNSI